MKILAISIGLFGLVVTTSSLLGVGRGDFSRPSATTGRSNIMDAKKAEIAANNSKKAIDIASRTSVAVADALEKIDKIQEKITILEQRLVFLEGSLNK